MSSSAESILKELEQFKQGQGVAPQAPVAASEPDLKPLRIEDGIALGDATTPVPEEPGKLTLDDGVAVGSEQPEIGGHASNILTELEDFHSSQDTDIPSQTKLQTIAAPFSVNSMKQFFGEKAQSFNTGLVDAFLFPSELINMSLDVNEAFRKRFFPTMPHVSIDARLNTQGFREAIGKTSFTQPPGQEATGGLNRGARFLGNSVSPSAVLAGIGINVLKSGVPPIQRTIMQDLAARTAASPKLNILVDVAGSVGAGIAGEQVRKVTDNPGIIATVEIAGGFLIPGSLTATRVLGPSTGKFIERNLLFLGKNKADAELQGELRRTLPNLEKAASEININSRLSVARQLQDEGMLQLEASLLDRHPTIKASYTEELRNYIDDLQKEAATLFAGDTGKARVLTKQQQEHIVKLAAARSQMAAQESAIAIAALGVNPSTREISVTTRAIMEKAYFDMRKIEKTLWEGLPQKAKGSFGNSQAAFADLMKGRSYAQSDPKQIPDYIRGVRHNTGELKGQLKRGFHGLQQENPTLGDIQALRTRVGDALDLAESADDRPLARVLRIFHQSLLLDLKAIKGADVTEAVRHSRQLNATFREGGVGELLNKGRSGKLVGPDETLRHIFRTGGLGSETSSSTIRQLVVGSPEAAPEVMQFVKTMFADLVWPSNGKYNPVGGEKFIASHKKNGTFEIFPNLESEMRTALKSSLDAQKFTERAAVVRQRGGSRFRGDQKRSAASLYLNAPVGGEMRSLIGGKNPTMLARAMVRKMGGDQDAIDGLKKSFAEELLKTAKVVDEFGNYTTNGTKFLKEVDANIETMKALGITDTEITRLRRIGVDIAKAQVDLPGARSRLTSGKIGQGIELLTAFLGAQFGGQMGSTTGSSMQMAGRGAGFGVRGMSALGFDKIEARALDIAFDNKAYKAFLLKNTTANPAQTERAVSIMDAWITGIMSEQVQEETKAAQGRIENPAPAPAGLNIPTPFGIQNIRPQ